MQPIAIDPERLRLIRAEQVKAFDQSLPSAIAFQLVASPIIAVQGEMATGDTKTSDIVVEVASARVRLTGRRIQKMATSAGYPPSWPTAATAEWRCRLGEKLQISASSPRCAKGAVCQRPKGLIIID